jgi:hypothetical protein
LVLEKSQFVNNLYLIGLMQVGGPRPRLTLVVPVGRLDEFARGRRDLRVLTVVRDLELLGLDVVHHLGYVLVGLLLQVSFKSLNYFLKKNRLGLLRSQMIYLYEKVVRDSKLSQKIVLGCGSSKLVTSRIYYRFLK